MSELPLVTSMACGIGFKLYGSDANVRGRFALAPVALFTWLRCSPLSVELSEGPDVTRLCFGAAVGLFPWAGAAP